MDNSINENKNRISNNVQGIDAAQVSKDVSKVRYFLTGCLIYAVIYTFCLYKNPSGITYPLFVLATIVCFRLFVKKHFAEDAKTGEVMPSACRFYEVSCLLLGLSTCLTDSPAVIFLNKLVIFFLIMCYFIHTLFDTSAWSFMQHLLAILEVVFGSLGCLLNSFSDYKWYRKNSGWLKSQGLNITDTAKSGFLRRHSNAIKSILLGIVIAIPLLAVSVSLLRSADILFDKMLGDFFDSIFNIHLSGWFSDLFSNIFGILFTTIIIFVVSYALWSFLGRRTIKEHCNSNMGFAPLTASTFTCMLAVIYVLFSFIQIFGLFLGNLTLPENYTYAEYARQGFFQLLFVCILNVILVLACLYFFSKSRFLQMTLTVISVCTYIMTASSAMRMIMYIQAYKLTFLRIAVLFGLAAVAFIMTGVLVSIYNGKFKLFRYCIVGLTVLFIIFSYSHPDFWIAQYNFEHINRSKPYSDVSYILELSDDAAPVYLSEDFKELCSSSDNLSNRYYRALKSKSKRDAITARTFNLSRFVASRMKQ